MDDSTHLEPPPVEGEEPVETTTQPNAAEKGRRKSRKRKPTVVEAALPDPELLLAQESAGQELVEATLVAAEKPAGEPAADEGRRTPLKLDPEAWTILEERARSLARVHDDTEEVLGEEVVIFRLGEGSYSLPARYIREVQPLESYTPLPSTPAFVVGLVNLRGRLLAALDIRPLLELPSRPPQPGAYLIVVAIGGIEVSLLADEVDEVRHGDTELAPALSATAGRGLGWVRGIDRDLNLVLDPHGLLSDPRIVVNSEA